MPKPELYVIYTGNKGDEQIMRTYAKDIEKETERKTAEKMIKMGKLSLEEIGLCVPTLSFDELKELEAEVIQLA